MGFVETEGLVLRKYNLADADRIVLVLTEKRGLIRGVANGAKRLKSKFSSSLEFFSRIHLNYFEKEERELVSIRDTDLIESVFSRLSNPFIYDAFAEIAELLIKFTPPNEPSPRLYHMTRHCIQASKENEDDVLAIRVYFELWLLKLAGFLPDWTNCKECSTKIDQHREGSMSPDYQIICTRCAAGAQPLSADVLFLFERAQRTSPQKFAVDWGKRKAGGEILGEILGKLSDLVLERAPIRGNYADFDTKAIEKY